MVAAHGNASIGLKRPVTSSLDLKVAPSYHAITIGHTYLQLLRIFANGPGNTHLRSLSQNRPVHSR